MHSFANISKVSVFTRCKEVSADIMNSHADFYFCLHRMPEGQLNKWRWLLR